MFKHPRFQGLSILALGALAGYVLAASEFRITGQATGATAPGEQAEASAKPPVQNLRIAQAVKKAAAANQAGSRKKPNIVFIMGDDIGMWNIGAYHRGLMAGRTPNLDALARQGMLFTDYYAEASCTAGRANFITGQLPIRTGLTTVGQAGAKVGLPAEACTIATASKRRAMLPGNSARIISAIATSTFPPSTASTNSSATCIIWTRWKTQPIRTTRRNF